MTRHGLSYHPAYKVWKGMMARCYDPTHRSFPDYGGRGIRVCKRWHDLRNFIADMGERTGPTLERKRTGGPYSKSNCVWADWKTQNNNRRNNRRLTHRHQSMTVAQWAIQTGICQHRIHQRLARGWTVARALTEPVGVYARKTSC